MVIRWALGKKNQKPDALHAEKQRGLTENKHLMWIYSLVAARWH